ncbi:MAG: hypothetical protein J6Z23_06775 [Lachnospiraceae bacterium]|nr:hypothetical protein [Lachnospiraceae bacterium]
MGFYDQEKLKEQMYRAQRDREAEAEAQTRQRAEEQRKNQTVCDLVRLAMREFPEMAGTFGTRQEKLRVKSKVLSVVIGTREVRGWYLPDSIFPQAQKDLFMMDAKNRVYRTSVNGNGFTEEISMEDASKQIGDRMYAQFCASGEAFSPEAVKKRVEEAFREALKRV